MSKARASLITVLAGLLAIAMPILLALRIASSQAEDFERARVLGFATDVLNRSDSIASQIYTGINRLVKSGASDPCAESQISIMREIDLNSSYVQAIGHVSDRKMVCSSLGERKAVTYDLGSANVVTSTGSTVYSNVAFPFANGKVFTVIERQGYAAIIHKDLPIDVATGVKGLSLATVTPDNRGIRSSRGVIKTSWLDRLGDSLSVTFIDNENVVAVARSDIYATIAVAALPITYLAAQTKSAAKKLIPTGLIASMLLIWAILHAVRMQLAMPAILKVALKRNEFFMVYQPIVDLATGKWIGAEALIRWRRPTGEMVRPDLFIPVAEDSGLIQRITEHVVNLVAGDAEEMFSRYPGFHVGINVSAADLHDRRTLDLLTKFARDTRAGDGNLLVEITERGIMDAEVPREMVRALRQQGIRIAIDDFGTGYSSLSYLETFELDYLKIDKSFVDKIGIDAASSQVVPHIIEMAKGLRLAMIAEGVETKAQAVYLRECGVQHAQGWLFSHPLSFEELKAGMLTNGAGGFHSTAVSGGTAS